MSRKIEDGLTPRQRHAKKKYEQAPMIDCACGCGEQLKAVDKYARPAKYVNGHNTRKYTGEASTKAAAQKRWVANNADKVRDAKRDRYRALKVKLMGLMGNVCTPC